MGKGKKVTVGYRYMFSMHMGLGRGPLDELVAIKIGDRTAWTGSVTSSQQIYIDAYNLFGGEKGEGGVRGACDIMMGEDTQMPNPSMASLFTLLPAFRRQATMFFDGIVCMLNPYPKPWSMRVRRALKGWDGAVWYPGKAAIAMDSGNIRAMNPAHIIVEALTNREWGRGLDRSRLDLATYQAAADKLYDEGFGLCFRYIRSGSINEFIQTVIDHIGAVQEIDRTTGNLTLTLIRDDYNVDDLPHFTYGTGLVEVEDFETPALDTTTNTLSVKYRDPITGEDAISAPVQNLAAVQASGAVSATIVEYFGLPTQDLAGRVAIRDLTASMGIIRRIVVHLDRRGRSITPGKVFRISAPDMGIENMVLRAGKQEDGTITNAEITITALQDVFGLPATTYVKPQPPGWVPPDLTARNVTVYQSREASYRDLYLRIDEANLQLIADTSAYMSMMAKKPDGLALNYRFWTGLLPDGLIENDVGDWTPNGVTGSIMPKVGTATTILLTDLYLLSEVTLGAAARCENEEMVVIALNTTTGSVTLGRGCQDSVPEQHPAGSRVWFYDNTLAEDETEYSSGQTVYAKMQTHTSAQDLALSSATLISRSMIGRQGRPYPPGNVRINGQALGVTSVQGAISLAWSHRDRIQEMDQLFTHTAGNIGPEPGTTYNIRIYNSAGTVLLRTITGETGTSWSYPDAFARADGAPGIFRFQLESQRDGLVSSQNHFIGVERIGLGFRLGRDLGGVTQ